MSEARGSGARLLSETEVRSLIGPTEALREVRKAFAKLASQEVVLPEVMSFDLSEHRGEVHAKGAYLRGTQFFSIKVASGFYDNPARGLPVGAGIVLSFEAATGRLAVIALDNGYLTELRTGAAGALAADLLAPQVVRQVGILGCGGQARYQLEALLGVRQPDRIVVYCRTPESAARYATEMEEIHGLRVVAASDPREAVAGSQIVVTTTPSRSPIVREEWVSAGTHVTAVGSDLPDKQELEESLLARSTVVADHLGQCLGQGEIHHAVAAGVIAPSDVHAELGEIVIGRKRGRTSEQEVTIADLTGVGALDAAVARYVTERALAERVGAGLALETASDGTSG